MLRIPKLDDLMLECRSTSFESQVQASEEFALRGDFLLKEVQPRGRLLRDWESVVHFRLDLA